MGMNIQTKFGYQERAFILSAARKGRLASGVVERILIRVGFDGSSATRIFYAIKNTSEIAPPEGLYAEYELVTEAEAKAEAREFHSIQRSYHDRIADDLN